MERIHIDNRSDWLAERNRGIGASEAAAVIGLSPWMSTLDLWNLKVGNTKPKDLSANEAVATGVRAEPALRLLYTAYHDNWAVESHPFDILYQTERPYMFATLDGEVTAEDGRKGILEIKTSTLYKQSDWRVWDGQIPDYYLAQCTHQLAVTGYDFADLYAALQDSRTGELTIRLYHMERKDMENDIAYLENEIDKFWELVTEKRMPKQKLTL